MHLSLPPGTNPAKQAMTINEGLADRVRELLAPCNKALTEKKMFGGICFMVDDKMCVGVKPERIMVRLDPAISDGLLEEPGCTPMSHGGRGMKGFIYVDEAVLRTRKQLSYWVNLALDFNDRAKSSKKK